MGGEEVGRVVGTVTWTGLASIEWSSLPSLDEDAKSLSTT